MEPIATSAFVVYLNMSSIEAGSFKQVQKNGKVFYDFENFTGRVGTRLFVTEGSQSIEIGRSEESAPADNNTRPGSRKGPTTKKGRSGKRGQKKMSIAALSILETSSSSSDDDSSLMEDSDSTEVLKERLKSVRFTEESESKSEEEVSSKEGDSESEESSSKDESEKEVGDVERNEASEEQEGKEEDHVPERNEASEAQECKEEAHVPERNEASEEQEGKEEDHVPIKNYSAWKKRELETECRLRDLTSDGTKATLVERLQGNDQEEELDEDSGQDEAVQEKRTLPRRNTRRH